MRRLSQLQERNLWRIIEGATAIGGFSSFCWGWGLWMHFAYTRPTSANALEGRVYPLDTHGWRVYLDAREHFTLESLFIAFGVLFLIGFVIDRVKKPFRAQWDR